MIVPSENATDPAAEPQSVADRIAAKFGVTSDEVDSVPDAPITPPDEPEPEGNEAQPENADVEIEWSGAKYRIPKELEPAIAQALDYTRKTQEVADQRRQNEYAQKALEASRAEIEFARTAEGEVQQLRQLDAYLEQLHAVNVDDLPFEEGIAHDRKVARLERQRAALNEGIRAKHEEFNAKRTQTLDGLKTQARELLSKQFGGLDDKIIDAVQAHAKTFGYTDQDVEMISLDPRAQAMLYKAYRFDQLQANKASSVQRAESAPALKPGSSNPMPQAVKDKLAIRKAIKNEPDSVKRAKLIEQRLADMF